MKKRFCYLDFEFYNSKQPKLELVSCVIMYKALDGQIVVETFWLHKDLAAQQVLAQVLLSMVPDFVFVAYAFQAEARALFQLLPCLRPSEIKAVDLYLEYRMLLNHNHYFAYGKQLIKGKIRTTTPPKSKWEQTEEDKRSDSNKPEYGLAAACFKTLGVMIDTDEKDYVRETIIRGVPEEIEAQKDRILEYNKSDVVHLRDMFGFFLQNHKESPIAHTSFFKGAHLRAEFAARAALMEQIGYPVNADRLKRFVKNIPAILEESAEACNEAEGSPKPFVKKNGLYSLVQKPLREWVEDQGLSGWLRTDKGQYSLSLDAFRKFYSSQSSGFAGAFLRHLSTKQSLNGFLPVKIGSKRKSFYDFLGKDSRARPYLGIYGAQSARSQPAATGFIPLKASWMRAFIQPDNGRALISIDYASQEFFIAALLSGDQAMVKDYLSGDPYLAFAKSSRLAPPDATKESHSEIRNFSKAGVLGMSYDMAAKGLSYRLSMQTGRTVTVEEAENFINLFYETYSTYAEWKQEIQQQYHDDGYLMLPCGWVMWGDNDNFRSVGNFPIQGFGSSVLRKAIAIAQDEGLDVLYPLHDAIYAECAIDEVVDSVYTLGKAMHEAFKFYFPEDVKKYANIRLDGTAWGPGLEDKESLSFPDIHLGVDFKGFYVDAKGRKDFERYAKYFME